MVTLRQDLEKFLYKETEGEFDYQFITNEILSKVTQTIDELSAQSHKGFCLRTANRIKNKINATGEEVSPEPKT